MLNVTDVRLARLKSPLRPRFATHQATCTTLALDPAWDRSVDIYPGMVAMKTVGKKATLINGTGKSYGLFGHFVAPQLGYDPIRRQGVPQMPVWVLGGPDAQFEILDPAFDSSVSWTEPTDGTILGVTYYSAGAKRGKLVPMGTASAGGNTVATEPIARLIEVVSATKIVIGGLQARTV